MEIAQAVLNGLAAELEVNNRADFLEMAHGIFTVDDAAAGGDDAVLSLQLGVDAVLDGAETFVTVLIQQAVKLYLKAHFGYDDQPEKWEAAYERLKAALSLSSDYTTGEG